MRLKSDDVIHREYAPQAHFNTLDIGGLAEDDAKLAVDRDRRLSSLSFRYKEA